MRANGMWVLASGGTEPASGGTEPASGGTEPPSMQISKKSLVTTSRHFGKFGCTPGGAAVSVSRILAPSIRGKFEGQPIGPNRVEEPASGSNPACLFLRKAIKLKKSQKLVL